MSSTAASNDIRRRSFSRRAVEAAIWGIPLVNYEAMLRAARNAGSDLNQIVYWASLPSWKNQTLTPNPDSIYLMPFYDTATAGPIVVEIPPAQGGTITGTLMDCWQFALEDVGPAGLDQGAGGKYLILPPDYDGDVPMGYLPLRSSMYQGYGLLRSLLKGRAASDVAASVAYGERIRLYPLSEASDPSQMSMVDVSQRVFDSTIPYDIRFFESLLRMVQSQPWLERDRAMIDVLRSIGIEKGGPFAPSTEQKLLLEQAVEEARDWLADEYETSFEPHDPSQRWFLPGDKKLVEAMASGYADPNSYPWSSRGISYYCAFSSIKHMGAGQFYLFVSRDSDGEELDGKKTYCLHVPAHVPVRQYWSVTLYDFDTHAFIRGMDTLSCSSLSSALVTNSDGSVDVLFGPEAPSGKESNWVPTSPDGRFEALFRFYASSARIRWMERSRRSIPRRRTRWACRRATSSADRWRT